MAIPKIGLAMGFVVALGVMPAAGAEPESGSGPAPAAPKASVGKEGLVVRSADGDFELKLRGLVQTDGRFFNGDHREPASDTFLLRRIRPIFEGTILGRFDFRIMPDFGEGKTVLQDAYMDVRFSPAVKVRAGKFKTPFGLERLQSASDLLFVERSLPTNLVPNRDVGVMVHGEPAEGRLIYALGLFNGVADGSSGDSDIGDSKEGAGRIFALPFKKSSNAGVQGLGFGLAATHGSSRGTMTATGLSGFRTAGQQTFFSYRTGKTAPEVVTADGRRRRISPQASYYVGRFGMQAEYAISSIDVRIDAASEDLKQRSWQSSASCLLTKDRASWKGVDPRRPFEPSARGWGALELAARFGWLKVDDNAFPVFADPEESSRKAREWALELNWYLNKNVRFMLQRARTAFKGGATSGDREDEKVMMGRLQVTF